MTFRLNSLSLLERRKILDAVFVTDSFEGKCFAFPF
jgi:hypothetical protein